MGFSFLYVLITRSVNLFTFFLKNGGFQSHRVGHKEIQLKLIQSVYVGPTTAILHVSISDFFDDRFKFEVKKDFNALFVCLFFKKLSIHCSFYVKTTKYISLKRSVTTFTLTHFICFSLKPREVTTTVKTKLFCEKIYLRFPVIDLACFRELLNLARIYDKS